MFADFTAEPVTILWGFLLMILLWVGLPAVTIYFGYRAISKARARRFSLFLPSEVARKVEALPPSAGQERLVTLILKDARLVERVTINSGALTRIAGKTVCRPEDLDFRVNDVADVCLA